MVNPIPPPTWRQLRLLQRQLKKQNVRVPASVLRRERYYQQKLRNKRETHTPKSKQPDGKSLLFLTCKSRRRSSAPTYPPSRTPLVSPPRHNTKRKSVHWAGPSQLVDLRTFPKQETHHALMSRSQSHARDPALGNDTPLPLESFRFKSKNQVQETEKETETETETETEKEKKKKKRTTATDTATTGPVEKSAHDFQNVRNTNNRHNRPATQDPRDPSARSTPFTTSVPLPDRGRISSTVRRSLPGNDLHRTYRSFFISPRSPGYLERSLSSPSPTGMRPAEKESIQHAVFRATTSVPTVTHTVPTFSPSYVSDIPLEASVFVTCVATKSMDEVHARLMTLGVVPFRLTEEDQLQLCKQLLQPSFVTFFGYVQGMNPREMVLSSCVPIQGKSVPSACHREHRKPQSIPWSSISAIRFDERQWQVDAPPEARMVHVREPAAAWRGSRYFLTQV